MTIPDASQRLYAMIDGVVQGVGFRAFVVDRAAALRLTGWVRNTYNGQVEVIAEGPRPALEKLLNHLRVGPRMAFVSEIHHEWQPSTGEFRSFVIQRTS